MDPFTLALVGGAFLAWLGTRKAPKPVASETPTPKAPAEKPKASDSSDLSSMGKAGEVAGGAMAGAAVGAAVGALYDKTLFAQDIDSMGWTEQSKASSPWVTTSMGAVAGAAIAFGGPVGIIVGISAAVAAVVAPIAARDAEILGRSWFLHDCLAVFNAKVEQSRLEATSLGASDAMWDWALGFQGYRSTPQFIDGAFKHVAWYTVPKHVAVQASLSAPVVLAETTALLKAAYGQGAARGNEVVVELNRAIPWFDGGPSGIAAIQQFMIRNGIAA